MRTLILFLLLAATSFGGTFITQPPGGIYQAETLDYQRRIIANGGTISATDLAAHDEFVCTGKKDGWWNVPKLEIGTIAGDQLAAAVVKLKYVVSGTLENHNLVESDYAPNQGFTVGAFYAYNTTKYLSTGYDASAQGLVYNNVSYGLARTGELYEYYGLPFSANRGSNIPLMGIGENIFTPHAYFGAAINPGFTVVCSVAGAVRAWRDGVLMYDQAEAASNSDMTGTFELFRSWNGATYFHTGNACFYFLSAGLTDAQARSLSDATRRLMVRLGRFPANKLNLVVFGDSIAQGQGTDALINSENWPDGNARKRFGRILADAFSANEVNVGMPSSRLRATAGGVAGGYQRISDVTRLMPDMLVILYGTNDAGNDGTTDGDAGIASDFEAKLETIIADALYVRAKTVVDSPPYSTVYSATKMALYEAKCAQAAAAQGVGFVDLFQAIGDKPTPSDYLQDGIHPNNAGNALIASRTLDGFRGRFTREATLNFGSIAAGSAADLTVTLYGARAGNAVSVTPPPALDAGLGTTAWVSASDTITVRVSNVTSGAIDPASGVFVISLQK